MSQIEAICISGYCSQITNYNTQISNNFKIENSNDKTVQSLIGFIDANLSVLNFGYQKLAEDHGRKPVGESVPLKQMKEIV